MPDPHINLCLAVIGECVQNEKTKYKGYRRGRMDILYRDLLKAGIIKDRRNVEPLQLALWLGEWWSNRPFYGHWVLRICPACQLLTFDDGKGHQGRCDICGTELIPYKNYARKSTTGSKRNSSLKNDPSTLPAGVDLTR